MPPMRSRRHGAHEVPADRGKDGDLTPSASRLVAANGGWVARAGMVMPVGGCSVERGRRTAGSAGTAGFGSTRPPWSAGAVRRDPPGQRVRCGRRGRQADHRDGGMHGDGLDIENRAAPTSTCTSRSAGRCDGVLPVRTPRRYVRSDSLAGTMATITNRAAGAGIAIGALHLRSVVLRVTDG
jgi:hypothetical protein